MTINNICQLTKEINKICINKTYDDLLKYDINSVKLILYNIFDILPLEIIEIINKIEKKLVLIRNQDHLRQLIIKRDKKCILSGLHSDCCEISHIHPFCDSDENQKYDVNNVILIGAHFHKLFDKYLWSIDPNNFKIILSKKCKLDESYQMFAYDNKEIKLTNGMKKYLQMHYDKFIELDK